MLGRTVLIVATLAGLAAVAALTALQGFRPIGSLLHSAGWALGFVALAHLLQVVLSGCAWRAVLDGEHPVSLRAVIGLRWIRESISNLMPMTQIGGEVVAVRLLAVRGMPVNRGTASVVVDTTLELVTQVIFTIAGIVLLFAHRAEAPLPEWLFQATGLMLVLVGLFLFAQQRGAFRWLEQLFDRIATRLPGLHSIRVPGLHDLIVLAYRDRRVVLAGCGWHLVSWVAGVGEIWTAMQVMGIDGTLEQAFILESLSQAARSAAFVVPGGLGVQEGGFMLLGTLIGIPPDEALALSYAKRVRELLLGAPGLLAWYLIEGRQLRRRRKRTGFEPSRT